MYNVNTAFRSRDLCKVGALDTESSKWINLHPSYPKIDREGARYS